MGAPGFDSQRVPYDTLLRKLAILTALLVVVPRKCNHLRSESWNQYLRLLYINSVVFRILIMLTR